MIDDLFVRTTNLRNLCRIQKAKVLALIHRVPRDDWLVMAWVLASKLLLFLFGIKSFQILEDKYLPTGNSWLEIWNRWDSLIYQRIAQVGYDPNYVWKAWFYPLFPWSCAPRLSFLRRLPHRRLLGIRRLALYRNAASA